MIRVTRSNFARFTALLLTLAMLSCGQPASQGGFDSPDPSSRLYAIVRAGQTKDRAAIPRLIESLASDDQAVRMYAIASLERITGKTYGFVHYQPPARREEALQRWLAALRSGELGADVRPPDSPPAQTANGT
jgi:hypothetical protein